MKGAINLKNDEKTVFDCQWSYSLLGRGKVRYDNCYNNGIKNIMEM